MLFLSVLIASFSQILLKKSAKKQYDSFLKEYLNPYVIIGYAMMVGSTILTILAYREVAYKNGPVIESLGYQKEAVGKSADSCRNFCFLLLVRKERENGYFSCSTSVWL